MYGLAAVPSRSDRMSILNHSQKTLNIKFSSLKLQDSIGSGMTPTKALQAARGTLLE